ncbi:MAG TPA: 16S rRNA (adenine(1518)-N(6)/adenine(1519)-N(6))-dimethyltransferase RsmA [Gemmatimonadaceae bacterium]|jgi:16S rRNA (adenine1518-N6/adenine1519-N6)-dimethyltransferase|nr:16S rRNA (adenine(1518)-N(6)/adenine(1519)-N(6))-dimethyltransferase RsmA [Gemmatimonadaceae bacterium]
MPSPRGGAPRHPPVRKSLGQHFLDDRRILERIVDALELSGRETVVEVGPGRGSLTALLASKAKRLVAIEYDRALAARLRERFAESPSVTIIESDVLSVSLADAAGTDQYRVIGNVPYYITTPILFHALERPRAERAVYLVQREVAQRIVAVADSDAYGALSVNVQSVARAEILFRVGPGSFQPPPKVESAVIRIEPRSDPVIEAAEERAFRRFVIDAFGLRRKQMRRILRTIAGLSIEQADVALEASRIDPTARPETLTAAEFATLLRAVAAVNQRND